MAEAQEKDMSFLDHLEELRFRIMRSAIAILVGATAIFIFDEFVFDVVIFGPMKLDFFTYVQWCNLSHWLGIGNQMCLTEVSYEVISTSMAGQFTAHIMVSIVGGMIFAFPYIFYELWSFVKPGLKQKEIIAVRGIIFSASVLFFTGVLFGYYLITPLSLQFLGSYQVGDVKSMVAINSYMKTVVSCTFSAGLVFQLPVLVYFLTKIGIIGPALLRKYRKHAFIGVLVLAAIITPPDLTSQIIVTIPIMILYELSIFISARVERRKAKQ